MTRLRSLCAVLVLCPILGCGGATPRAEGPDELVSTERPSDPVEMLPSDTFAVLRVDVAQIRRSPYYGTISEWLAQVGEMANQDADSDNDDFERLVQILDRTDVAFVGTVPGPSEDADPDILVVMRGTYREGELERFVRGQETFQGHRQTVRTEVRGERQVLVGEETSATAIDDHTWLIATGRRLDEMIARAEGRGGATPRSSDTFRAMAERVGFDRSALALVAEATPWLKRALAEDASATEAAFVNALVSFGARLTLSDGLDGLAIAETTSELVATAIVEEAESGLRDLSGQMMVAAVGLGAILENTRVRVEGPSAVLKLRADDATTRAFLARIGGFLTLALQAAAAMGGEGGYGGDAPPTDAAPPPS